MSEITIDTATLKAFLHHIEYVCRECLIDEVVFEGRVIWKNGERK